MSFELPHSHPQSPFNPDNQAKLYESVPGTPLPEPAPRPQRSIIWRFLGWLTTWVGLTVVLVMLLGPAAWIIAGSWAAYDPFTMTTDAAAQAQANWGWVAYGIEAAIALIVFLVATAVYQISKARRNTAK